MRFLATALVMSLSFSAFAQDLNSQIETKLSTLKTLSDSGQTRILDRADKQTVLSHIDAALEVVESNIARRNDRMDRRADRRDTRSDNRRDDWRRSSSFERNTVAAYTNDYCGSTSMIVELRPRDNCDRLSLFSTQRVWSVKINGQCVNTPDTTFGRACNALVDLTASQKPISNDLEVYTNDYCGSTSKLTTLDPRVDCQSLGTVLNGSKVWSVKLNGQCVNVPDTTFSINKCEGYQVAILASYENDGSRRARGTIELFSNDYCGSTSKVVNVDRGTDCMALNKIFNGQKVWSAKMRGQCVNISDTTFLNACETYAR